MAVALALLAALSFAAGTVLQQRGTLQAPAAGDDARFLLQILQEPVWLIGASLQALGWILQAAALDRGPLIVVQTLTTLSLVIALPLGVRLTGQRVGRPEVVAALAVVAGVVVFLAAGAPSSGNTNPSAAEWWTAGLLSLLLVGGVAYAGFHRQGSLRAALFGGAAGVGFALQAAVTKVFVGELGHGVGALLTTWSTYVLIVSAVVGFVLQQSALKTGNLAPAMAASNASTLVFSAVFGIVVFDERLAHGHGRIAIAVFGLVVAVVGVVRLAASEPGALSAPGSTESEQARDSARRHGR
jgi:drug/metabolite transporter (DMT)-like permease